MKNLAIESDNLIAMERLLPEYEGKVDVMPIDPPYNTDISYIGYKDKDNKWLDFMEQRLRPAYKFLSDKGVMFIHIDENEYANLYNLCAKIFGMENLMSLIWKKTNELFDKKRVEKPLESGIRRTHEFIIVCFKDRKNTELKPIMQPKNIDGKWIQELKPMETILDNLGTTSSAKDELAELLGSRDKFSTPKPVKLIKEFIRSASTKDSIVMDIFAGSGTTAQATMELNAVDNGTRLFIIITNNESDIFNRVTIPRIEKAIEKNKYKVAYDKIKW